MPPCMVMPDCITMFMCLFIENFDDPISQARSTDGSMRIFSPGKVCQLHVEIIHGYPASYARMAV